MQTYSFPREVEVWQRRLAAIAARLNDGLIERDRAGEFHRAGWEQCAGLGLAGLPVPQAYGGSGAGAGTMAAALESLGYVCRDNGLSFALGAHLWGCVAPILAFGDEAQKARWLPGLAGGRQIGCLAVSEAEAGSDALHPRTTARRQPTGYLLNGTKRFVTNGPVADIGLVLARLEGSENALAFFVVERGMAGVDFGPAVEKMGLRSAAMGEIGLENCLLPEENLLGGVGDGGLIFHYAMLWERGLILAPALGAMQRQLERCVAYAQERKQFGQPIGKFQLVSSRLVDMRLRLESARLLLQQMVSLLAAEELAHDFAAITKLSISEAWVANCQDALQIHGGYGYLTESGVERELRDALAGRLYSGTSEMQRQIIAQWMGVG